MTAAILSARMQQEGTRRDGARRVSVRSWLLGPTDRVPALGLPARLARARTHAQSRYPRAGYRWLLRFFPFSGARERVCIPYSRGARARLRVDRRPAYARTPRVGRGGGATENGVNRGPGERHRSRGNWGTVRSSRDLDVQEGFRARAEGARCDHLNLRLGGEDFGVKSVNDESRRFFQCERFECACSW